MADPSASPTNPGLLMLVDVDTGQVAPWHAPFSDLQQPQQGWDLEPTEGYSGLAFAADGSLYGASTAGTGSASRLVRIDPRTGQPFAAPRSITFDGQPIRVGDLAIQPGTVSPLYGLGASDGGGGVPGRLYVIDPNTGQATPDPDAPLWLTEHGIADGLAVGADGMLYATGMDQLDNRAKLYVRRADATEHVVQLSERIVGLDLFTSAPATGTLVGSTSGGALVTINSDTGQLTEVVTDSPLRGVAGDVAFQPRFQAGTLDVFYQEHFETGDGGYIADNTGRRSPGMWHFSVGRSNDGLINHTPIHNWYYGAFESSTGGGHYFNDLDHRGVLLSPWIPIPTCSETTASFSYLLGTRESVDVDWVEVQIDDGTSITTALSRRDGTLPETGNCWLTATVDLTQYAGKEIQLRFVFDTGPGPPIDPEGWYVDDIVVAAVRYSVCGYKWHDENHDGVWDAGEPGLNGWTIYADLDRDGQYDAGTGPSDPGEPAFVTANDGWHDGAFWLNLPPGDYILREVLPEGWKQRYPGAPDFGHLVTVVSGGPVVGDWEQSEPPNFGNFQPDISGYKWHDEDHDRVWDTDETGANGCTIYLDLDSDSERDIGEPFFVTTYDGTHDGAFWFTDLAPGTYTIREELQDGWKQSFPGKPGFEHTVTIDPPQGQRAVGRWAVTEPPNFGNFQPDISGYKWHDLNHDGVWGAGEPGLNGWTIYLDLNDDNRLSPGEPSFATRYDGEHDGAFWFTDLPAGTYTVREVLPDCWKQSYPDELDPIGPSWEHVVTIDPAAGLRSVGSWGVAEEPNFGDFQPDISGYKWHDLNHDGIWDQNEPGLNGLTVYLDLDNDNQLSPGEPTFVTRFDGQHDGAYWFTDLNPAQTYVVRQVLPEDWKQSYPDAISHEHVVTVGTCGRWGVTEPPNFGDFQPDISGYKWHDVNHDGVWDAGEPGLNGWTIYLDLNDDNRLSPGEPSFATRYDGEHDGAFWFMDLPAGTYTVREVLPDCWKQSYPDELDPIKPSWEHVVTIDPPAGQRSVGRWGVAEEPNFGNYRPVTDLGIDKRDDDSNAVAGTEFTYTLEVTNYGPSDSTGATITDTLPRGWKLTPSYNPTCNGDAKDPQTVTCAIGPLKAGEKVIVGLTVDVPAGALPGKVVNCAEIRANETDPNSLNDRDCEPTDVIRQTDLAIDKRDDGSNAVAGKNYTYTLQVANLGPSDSSGATVTDLLPEGWMFVSSSNPSCVGDANNPQTVTCTLGPLLVGSTAGFTLTAAVPADASPGTVTNEAEVIPHEPDPNPGNNRDWEPTTVDGGGLICGYQWNDLDGDGLWDAGEPGLNGWIVYVDTDNDDQFDPGEAWDRTHHDGTYDGYYSILVDPGTHAIRVVLPPGWVQTYPQQPDEHLVTVVANEVKEGGYGEAELPNFGSTALVSIHGYAFDDLDGDGTHDAGEPGLAGVTITLVGDVDGDGIPDTLTGTTDDLGEYRFQGLYPGEYTVTETVPAGWFASTLTSCTRTLTSGQELVAVLGQAGLAPWDHRQEVGPDPCLAFGNYRKAIQEGIKYEDANGNGTYDPGTDNVLEDWTIYAYADTGTVPGKLDLGDTWKDQQLTGADGKYRFELEPGAYIIVEEARNAWFQSQPIADVDGGTNGHGENGYAVVLQSGDQDAGNDFGNYRNARIGGSKWHDLNANSTWDEGEPPLPGWSICIGNICQTTDANGQYAFDLPPGTYTVREEHQSDWYQSYPAELDPVYVVTVESGQQELDNHFGNWTWASASGVKFEDLVPYGDPRQPGEPGLPRWTIYIDYNDNGVLDAGEPAAETGADGTYSIAKIRPGTYWVREVAQNGWTNTYPPSGNYLRTFLSGGSETGLDFGNYGISPMRTRITVIKDAVPNALQEFCFTLGGGGLTNPVRFCLVDDGVTPATRERVFGDLPPGTYVLTEQAVPGWDLASLVIVDPDHGSSVAGGTATIDLDEGEQIAVVFVNTRTPEQVDWGDAPDSYRTTAANDGARHRIVPGFHLGAEETDAEPDGQPTPGADGDDQHGLDDEQGVEWLTRIVPGEEAWVRVSVTDISGQGSVLDAWFDFDRNGNWDDPGEKIIPGKPVIPGQNEFHFTVPADAKLGPSYARFRLSREGVDSYWGSAPDGEVEDYASLIEPPASLVQFITPMSVYRLDGPFVRPPDFQVAISGFVWYDQDGDGTWDNDEEGLDGVVMELVELPTGIVLDRQVTRPEDLNGDGVIDPLREQGQFWFRYWFPTTGWNGSPATTCLIRQVLPSGVLPPSFPGGGHNPPYEYLLTLDGDNLSYHGHALATATPNFGNPDDFVNNPPAETTTIKGYKWHDLNQNGEWDEGEPGRAGWRFFIDLNRNGVPEQGEPLAITGDNGGYVFAGLPALDDSGTPIEYMIREDTRFLSDGTFQVQRFPAAGEYVVQAQPGQVIEGRLGFTEPLNFGGFDYSPLVRPADDEYGHMRADATLRSTLETAFRPWQSFRVTNTTEAAFTITEVDTSGIRSPGDKLVTVRPSLPVTVPSNESVEFFAFYDPAVRVDNGSRVVRQFPDWMAQTLKSEFGGTWQIGDTVTITVEAVSFDYTVQSPAISTFLADLAAQLNASCKLPEINWGHDGTSLTATGPYKYDPGRPGANPCGYVPNHGAPFSFSVRADSDAGIVAHRPSGEALESPFGGTWQAGDIITVVTSGKSVSYTTQSESLPEILIGLVRALRESPEPVFQAIDWAQDGARLIATAKTPGTMFTFAIATDSVAGAVTDPPTSETRAAHAFALDDHLEMVTDAGLRFRVDLVGGSTYDSDIFYDGYVDFSDYYGRLDDILTVRWPTVATTVQEVRIAGTNLSGTFTLTFAGQTTAPIPWNAPNYVLDSVLETLPNVTDVEVRDPFFGNSDSDWEIIFVNPAGTGLPLMLIDASGISGTIEIAEVKAVDSRFDPTSDINARCTNDAKGLTTLCSWAITGTPPREIGLGDFGPLNVEWLRGRAPFLDLDADNSSTERGVDYATTYAGDEVAIADSDASFANSAGLLLSSLRITITNPLDGADERFEWQDKSGGNLEDTCTAKGVLCLKPRAGQVVTVGDFLRTLKTVTYTNDSLTPSPGTRIIEVVATGASKDFTVIGEPSERVGNVALSRIVVLPPTIAGSPVSAILGHEKLPDTIEPTDMPLAEAEADPLSLGAAFNSPNAWHNSTNPYDVNGSGDVTPLDALIIVNYLNEHPGAPLLPNAVAVVPPFYDVSGDNLCTPQDALLVINWLKHQREGSPEGESDTPSLRTDAEATTEKADASRSGTLPARIVGLSEPDDATANVQLSSDGATRQLAGPEQPFQRRTAGGERGKTLDATTAGAVWDDAFVAELRCPVECLQSILLTLAEDVGAAGAARSG